MREKERVRWREREREREGDREESEREKERDRERVWKTVIDGRIEIKKSAVKRKQNSKQRFSKKSENNV